MTELVTFVRIYWDFFIEMNIKFLSCLLMTFQKKKNEYCISKRDEILTTE